MTDHEYSGPERRQGNPITLEDVEAALDKRLDKQDDAIAELRKLIILRNAQDDDLRPTLQEMVLLWRGSKIMIPLLVVAAGAIWGFVAWTRDHIKL